MKRTTNAEKAAASGILPRLLNEAEAAIYLGMSVSTLQNIRAATPKRYTKETWRSELAKGKIVPPPFVPMSEGKKPKIGYDIRDLDTYIDILPRMGRLPKDYEDED
jgi:hypothetical protein